MFNLILSLFTLLWSFESFAHGISEEAKQAMIEGGYLQYIVLGAEHMITGYDHLLFLFGVIFFLTKFKDIVNQDPEIIIFLPCGFNIQKTKEELKNFFKKNDNWKTLKSFKNKKIFIADGNQFFNRPGPRLLESLEIFAEIMHPNLFNFNHKYKDWMIFND